MNITLTINLSKVKCLIYRSSQEATWEPWSSPSPLEEYDILNQSTGSTDMPAERPDALPDVRRVYQDIYDLLFNTHISAWKKKIPILLSYLWFPCHAGYEPMMSARNTQGNLILSPKRIALKISSC